MEGRGSHRTLAIHMCLTLAGKGEEVETQGLAASYPMVCVLELDPWPLKEPLLKQAQAGLYDSEWGFIFKDFGSPLLI